LSDADSPTKVDFMRGLKLSLFAVTAAIYPISASMASDVGNVKGGFNPGAYGNSTTNGSTGKSSSTPAVLTPSGSFVGGQVGSPVTSGVITGPLTPPDAGTAALPPDPTNTNVANSGAVAAIAATDAATSAIETAAQ
jgi:hypothetical protein